MALSGCAASAAAGRGARRRRPARSPARRRPSTQRSIRPPRLMSPRPTKCGGNISRSPKIGSSSSTYLPDAMLPSSTTSQSGPIAVEQRARAPLERLAVRRVADVDVDAGERAERVERHRRVGGAQAGVRRDHEHAAGGDRIGGIGRLREPPRVGELAAEVQAADEAEHVAERRARRRCAAAAPARTARRATSPSARGCRRSWRATAGRRDVGSRRHVSSMPPTAPISQPTSDERQRPQCTTSSSDHRRRRTASRRRDGRCSS